MNKNIRTLALAAAAILSLGLAATSSVAAVETYVIDPVHSSVAFKIRHFVSKVPGAFTKFQGTIIVDRDNLEKSSVNATIDLASVSTANQKRDAHLKGADFFDTAQYPEAAFVSTAWKKTGDDTYDVTGNLTLHGVTKSVVLNVELLAFGPGPQGAQLSGWQATATLKKSDFGVNGPSVLGTALGEDVSVIINIEAALKK